MFLELGETGWSGWLGDESPVSFQATWGGLSGSGLQAITSFNLRANGGCLGHEMKVDVDRESSEEATLPSPGVPVWVQCQSYRCLAARDREGRWRTYPNGLPIEEVLQILPFPR